MNLSFLKQPLNRFLVFSLILYIIWKLLYDLVLQPYTNIDLNLIQFTIRVSKFFLEAMGYEVFMSLPRLIGIDGTSGLLIGDPCDGMELFGLFTIFIIAFPGPPLKKMFFIPIGILCILSLNIFRVIGLAIVQLHTSREWTEFNHTYTFTILIYGCIFLLWMYWVKKFSGISFKKKQKTEKL